MKILQINSVYGTGSTGKIVYDLYTRTREDGHQAAVCYGRGPVVKGENILKFGLDWETYLHAGLTRLTGLTGCWSFFSTRRLLQFMDIFHPDVIHLHEPHAYFVNLSPLFRYIKDKDIPLVYTFHCEFAYTGKCGYAYECERWKSGCGHCPDVRCYPSSLFFDFTAYMFQQKRELLSGLSRLVITTPSQWLSERAKQSFLKGRDIRVVHNGIDTGGVFHPWDSRDLRKRHGLAAGEKVVLAVAPDLMSARKGGQWVAKLAEMMTDVRFILIGVEDLSETFPPNVTALGRTENQEELAAYYSLVDCFVICSKKETFSLTCAESLCCGTPIAGFCAGAPETIFPSPMAEFVHYGDLNTLEQAVRTQLERCWERDAIAQEAAKMFSSRRMYEDYKKMYQEIVK